MQMDHKPLWVKRNVFILDNKATLSERPQCLQLLADEVKTVSNLVASLDDITREILE